MTEEQQFQYRLVTVADARRMAEQGWGPVPHVVPVHDQSRGFVGSTTYVWIRKEMDV